jgi:hypothetical protein
LRQAAVERQLALKVPYAAEAEHERLPDARRRQRTWRPSTLRGPRPTSLSKPREEAN